MFQKLIDSFVTRKSGLKKMEINLNDFFPLTEQDFKEYKGTYTSKQDHFSFMTLIENMKRMRSNGEDAILQNRAFIRDNGTIIFSDDIVFCYQDEVVFEYSRSRNQNETVHPEPLAYLDTYVKGKYPDDVFVFKTFQEIFIRGNVCSCLVVTKKFYEGIRLQRIERLYFVKGVGMIKYEEESFYPNKFKIVYELSEEVSGYRMILHDSHGYFLYHPLFNRLTGDLTFESNRSISLIIETEEDSNNQTVETTIGMIESMMEVEKNLKQQIVKELLATDHEYMMGNEAAITSIDFIECMNVSTILVANDGKMEVYYDVDELFDGYGIIATLDEEMNLDSVDFFH